MGRTSFEIFREVVLPQLRRPIASGALLVALYALSDFGAVAAMRHEVFTWVIYGAYRAGFNPTRAATLSLVLIAAAFALTFAESLARGKSTGNVRTTSPRSRHRHRSLGESTIIFGASVAVLIPAIGVPVVNIIAWLNRTSTRSVDWSSVWATTGQSFVNGSATAIVTLLLALPVAWCAVRLRGAFSALPERLTYITHSLPGIVVAISVVYVGIRVARPWYQEFPLLIFGQVIIFLPVMVASLRAALEKTPVYARRGGTQFGDKQVAHPSSRHVAYCITWNHGWLGPYHAGSSERTTRHSSSSPNRHEHLVHPDLGFQHHLGLRRSWSIRNCDVDSCCASYCTSWHTVCHERW